MNEVAPQVRDLCELFGPGVLLLPWPWGKKGDKRRWKHRTAADMDNPAYLRSLGKGNIGVAQGRVSGGLCSLDIDSDAELASFMKLNPAICNTLLSRGRRGGNLWWWMDGYYPPLTVLKRHGEPWGEWRSTGAQTIIYGQHPEGHPYEIVQRVKPVRIQMIQIQWPEGIYPLLRGGSMPNDHDDEQQPLIRNRTDETQETEATHDNHATDAIHATKDTKEIGVVSELEGSSFPEEGITRNLPTAINKNHYLLFDLAREVRTFEEQNGGRFKLTELREIFDRWYAPALPHLRAGDSQDAYFLEFMKGYPRVKYLLGQEVFHDALARARNSEPPPEVCAVIKAPNIRLLAALCRELQKLWGAEPFFLSCRMIAKEFQVCVSTASLWLNGLEGCGFIKTVEKGDNIKKMASRFRYLLPV